MGSCIITSKRSSGSNRTGSTLSSSRLFFVYISISCTYTSCLDSFTFRSFYPRNQTYSSPSISYLCSLSSNSDILSLSASYLQLCLGLDLSASNTCASSYIARASLLLVSTLSAFTVKIPICWRTGGSSSRLLLITPPGY